MSRLDAELVERIADAVQRGATRATAAQTEGVHRSTLFGWLRRGHEEPATVYARLVEAVERAEATCKVAAISRAFPLDGELAPRDALAFLERRWPAEWSQRIHHHVTSQVDVIYAAIEREFSAEPQILARMFEAITEGRSHGLDTDDADGAAPRPRALAAASIVNAASVTD